MGQNAKWIQNVYKIASKWIQNRPKVDPKLSQMIQNGSKVNQVGPKYDENEQKLSH